MYKFEGLAIMRNNPIENHHQFKSTTARLKCINNDGLIISISDVDVMAAVSADLL